MIITEEIRQAFVKKLAEVATKAQKIDAHWAVIGHEDLVGKMEYRVVYTEDAYEARLIADGWKDTYDKMKLYHIIYVDGLHY